MTFSVQTHKEQYCTFNAENLHNLSICAENKHSHGEWVGVLMTMHGV